VGFTLRRLNTYDGVALPYDQAASDAKAAAAKAKEAETVKLRAQQERASDTRNQIDELRAQRYASDISCIDQSSCSLTICGDEKSLFVWHCVAAMLEYVRIYVIYSYIPAGARMEYTHCYCVIPECCDALV
jgi:hypothetical protein